MVGRYGLWVYQNSVFPLLLPKKSLYFLTMSKTINVLWRHFWCGRSSTLCSAREIRLDSAGINKKTTKTICGGSQEDANAMHSVQVKKDSPGSISEYFDLSPSLEKCEQWKEKFVSTMLVYPNFVSPEEEATLMKEIEPYISRLHYENSHWDDAIHEYRETERSRWNKKNELIINRIRSLGFPPGVPQLKLVHILDLAKKGVIKPHIDSVRFCGNTIAGVSILSDCIMRLRHDVQRHFFCDVYLPRYSLYIMKEFVRYEFTHEILGETDSTFKMKPVARDRRISIICRNEPENSPSSAPIFKVMK